VDPRRAPQGIGPAIWRISVLTAATRRGRPGRGCDRRRQYRQNPSRCQRMTVAGCTSTRASRHAAQHRRSPNQRSRSTGRNRGRRSVRVRSSS
jgi:hypothetical protein